MSLKAKQIDLSIVIPALDEERRIGRTLDELAVFLKKDPSMKSIVTEVIVVSADSTDRTHELATKHGKKIPNFKLLKPGVRVGKGRDVQHGMLKTSGHYALFMDADLATPLRHIPAFYKRALKGNDLVVATRNLKKHHSHLPRRTLSLAGNAIFRILGGVWIEDSQCGFKLFNQKAVRICFERQTIMRWGFDMELLAIAKSNRLTIEQVRINDWKHMPDGTFDPNRLIRNALESLGELIHIAVNRVKRSYRVGHDSSSQ